MKKILIFVTVWLGLSFGLVFNAHAAGGIHVMISGGPYISESLQSLEYRGKSREPDGESGYGLVFDYIFEGGHAIAVDYYRFTEEFDETPELYSSTIETNVVFLGYRHHFPSGFYLGGGVTIIDKLTGALHDFPVEDGSGNIIGTAELHGGYGKERPIALTLGYQYAFSSGFSLGVHLLNTLPTTFELNSLVLGGTVYEDEDEVVGDLEDFSIRSVGLLLGYAW